MKFKKILFIFIPFIILLFSLDDIVLAKDDLEISIGYEKNNGYTTYTIYDKSFSWKSILDFPLDSYLKTFKIHYYNIIFIIKYNTNYSNAQKFIDRDWVNNIEGDPYIYAEAKSLQKTPIFDISNVFYKKNKLFHERSKFTLGIGYEKKYYQHYIFDAEIEYITGYSYFLKDNVLYYNIRYHLPYIFLNYDYNYNENFSLNFTYNNTPLVYVKDYDDHILRNKVSGSKAHGSGDTIKLSFLYKSNNKFLINTSISKSEYIASGYQTQKFKSGKIYDDIISEVNLKIFSFSIELNYSF